MSRPATMLPPVLRQGFRDGSVGLIVSAMNAHYVFLKFAKLRALQLQAVRDH